eukprot:TRINITY_DN68632_c0_g1_i1.p1 TRINITY_DN68632_c0_g1~~TRINITY_DN68632_c0_g1_i1.p1  ORF type:complete len:588 (+),score=102.98 TRINITY_DN68632_c0_g1_i1:93-1856(+)
MVAASACVGRPQMINGHGYFQKHLRQLLEDVNIHVLEEVERLQDLAAQAKIAHNHASGGLPAGPETVLAVKPALQTLEPLTLPVAPECTGENGVEPDGMQKARTTSGMSDEMEKERQLDPRRAASAVDGDHTMSLEQGFREHLRETKQKVREAVNPREYNVFDLYYETGFFQAIAKSSIFDNFVMMLVVVNAIWIGLELDLRKPHAEGITLWVVAEQMFCVLFTGELVVRLCACQSKRYLLLDGWFLFDLLLVSIMLIETWLLPLLSSLGIGSIGVLGNASVLRLLRLVRITRMAKLMRFMPELVIMVKGMTTGLRSVIATCFMLGFNIYVFAIVLRQLSATGTDGTNGFDSVLESMWTLFIESILGSNGDVISELGKSAWYLALIFFGFLFMTALTVFNMLVGIMCEVMTTISHERKEKADLELLMAQLKHTLSELDQDFDGRVSRPELEGLLDKPESILALHNFGVDVHALVDDIEVIFEGLPTRDLSFIEFVEVISRYRANHAATISAVSGLRTLTRVSLASVTERLICMETSMRSLSIHMEKMEKLHHEVTASMAVCRAKQPEPESVGKVSEFPRLRFDECYL